MKTVTVRISASLLEQIRAVAKQHNRSLNGEILTAIVEHVKQQQKGSQA